MLTLESYLLFICFILREVIEYLDEMFVTMLQAGLSELSLPIFYVKYYAVLSLTVAVLNATKVMTDR